MKLARLVAHCHVLVLERFTSQKYSSESDPPGKRIARVPRLVNWFTVVMESNAASHTAVFMPNQRASATRKDCAAFTETFTTEGTVALLNWMSST